MNTIPETMRTAAIDRFGGPKVMTPHVLPVPELRACLSQCFIVKRHELAVD
jgi:hypothetical protein